MLKHGKQILLLILTTLFVAGCGQTGPLFIAKSEAEHNDGHFMMDYRGDNKTQQNVEELGKNED